jgi:hypothetical protein
MIVTKKLSRSFDSYWINIWSFWCDQRKRRRKCLHNILSNAVTENIKEKSTLRSLPIVKPTHQLNEEEIVYMLQELDSNDHSTPSSSDESVNIDELYTPKDQKAKKRAP